MGVGPGRWVARFEPMESDATDATEPEGVGDPGDPNLESIAADLADAEQALDRLADGTYWTDEVTGEPLSDDVMTEHPTTRRAVYVPFGPPVTSPHGIPRVEPAVPVESSDTTAPDPDS